jgi:hypothetical protein
MRRVCFKIDGFEWYHNQSDAADCENDGRWKMEDGGWRMEDGGNAA